MAALQEPAYEFDLSVVIPCLNGAPWLKDQLDSLIRYPYRGTYEVLLIDNGSTDSTLTILRAYAKDRSSWRVAVEPNRGKAHALNRGIEISRGRALVFLDQDDQVTDCCLNRLLDHLAAWDIVGGTREMFWDERSAAGQVAQEGLVRQPGWLSGVSGSALAVRAEVARDLRFCSDVGVGDDLDFSWRGQLRGYRVGLADDAVIRYRTRSTIRSRFRQGMAYGEASVLLYCKYRRHGIPRWTPSTVFSQLKTIIYWIMASPRSKGARLRLAYRIGLLAGRARTSVRRRVWCF